MVQTNEMDDLIRWTEKGFYCEAGDFFIDPHTGVDRAVVSHAHTDHAHWGCKRYLAASPSEHLLRMRVNADAEFTFAGYGETTKIRGVNISFHPAGHILGSAQIRLEHAGRVVVVTGDYKLGDDPTCESWQPIPCHLLVTESTFGLPIYRWKPQIEIYNEINHWWRANRDAGKCSIIYGYAVGKSQRILAGLDPSIGPIYTHGAVEKGVDAYRRSGVAMPETTYVATLPNKHDFAGSIVVAVPSAHGTSWIRRFGKASTAMVSGWMMVRGSRRRRSVDRGFVLSDHVDWPSLLKAIDESDPAMVWVTHGYTAAVARYLNETGRPAAPVDSAMRTEEDSEERLDAMEDL
ncbi:MAG: ligase-associated DNA damage response exonuclease [Planctomycetota bacterium]